MTKDDAEEVRLHTVWCRTETPAEGSPTVEVGIDIIGKKLHVMDAPDHVAKEATEGLRSGKGKLWIAEDMAKEMAKRVTGEREHKGVGRKGIQMDKEGDG